MWNLDAVFSQDPWLHLREVGVGGMLQKARLFYTLVLNQILGDRVLGVVEKENLDSILKSRDITLLTKVCLVKAMVFPVVVCRCESWIIKKTEHQRINAFEVWCWRIFLRVPWTARRSNQPILKEISPEYSLEGLMLKLKLQYFGHLMWKDDLLEKTLMLGHDWASWTDYFGRPRGKQWASASKN